MVGVAVLDQADRRLDAATQSQLGDVRGLELLRCLVQLVGNRVGQRRARSLGATPWPRRPRPDPVSPAAGGHRGCLGESACEKLALRQPRRRQLVRSVGHGQPARFVERKRDGLLGEMIDRRHQEVHAGDERLDADRVLTGHDAAVGDGLDDACPFEVGLVAAVDVEQDPGVGERGELGVAGDEPRLVRRLLTEDRSVPVEEAKVGAPLPQHPAGAGDELFASWRATRHEGDVDVALVLIAAPCVHRRRTPERQVHCRHPQAADGIERVTIDVEHHGAA